MTTTTKAQMTAAVASLSTLTANLPADVVVPPTPPPTPLPPPVSPDGTLITGTTGFLINKPGYKFSINAAGQIVIVTPGGVATADVHSSGVVSLLYLAATDTVYQRNGEPKVYTEPQTGGPGVNITDPSILSLMGIATPAPAPAPAPAPTPAPSNVNPSGQPVPGAILSWGSPFYVNDFNKDMSAGNVLAGDSTIGAYPYPWHDTNNGGDYHPELLYTNTSSLWVPMQTDANGRGMVNAVLPNGGMGQLYGRYAWRWRVVSASDASMKMAPLLWPDSGQWPGGGEIDFPEGDLNTTSATAFAHYADPNGGQDVFGNVVSFTNGWHTTVTEWTPGNINFITDGVLKGHSTHEVPNTSMHWVLQFETNTDGRPVTNGAKALIQIDWVAMWKYTGAGSAVMAEAEPQVAPYLRGVQARSHGRWVRHAR